MHKIGLYDVLSGDINKQLDSVIPLNPLTGLRDNLIHQYELELTASELSSIEKYLEVQDVHSPSTQLSDKELIALCPSRFVCTLSDAKALATQMRKVVADMDSKDKPTQEHNLNAPEPLANPTEPSSK